MPFVTIVRGRYRLDASTSGMVWKGSIEHIADGRKWNFPPMSDREFGTLMLLIWDTGLLTPELRVNLFETISPLLSFCPPECRPIP